MINEETYRQLVEMKLNGMAAAFRDALDARGPDALTFEERFGTIVDRE